MSARAEAHGSVSPRDSRIFLRHLHSRAEHGTSDRQGRLVLPEDMCRKLGLKGEVALVGNRGRFEIWNLQKMEARARGRNGHLPTRGRCDRAVGKIFRK